MDRETMTNKLIEKIDVNRLLSQAVHATLGANAAVGVGGEPIMGVMNGLLLEGLANSNLAHSELGGGVLGLGYGAMTIGQLTGWNLTPRKLFPDLWAQIELAFLKAKTGHLGEPISPPVTEEEMADIRAAYQIDRPPESYTQPAPPSYEAPLPPQFRGGRLQ